MILIHLEGFIVKVIATEVTLKKELAKRRKHTIMLILHYNILVDLTHQHLYLLMNEVSTQNVEMKCSSFHKLLPRLVVRL